MFIIVYEFCDRLVRSNTNRYSSHKEAKEVLTEMLSNNPDNLSYRIIAEDWLNILNSPDDELDPNYKPKMFRN